ncbi:MAG: glycosyltransferase [Phycisphaeraceae bacterium]|nr:glycosyltransferase [Phycisphaeraceae bacterium]
MTISVLLPISRAGPGLARALASITTQTIQDFEVLLILNGLPAADRPRITALVAEDPRFRALETPYPNLAAALNLGALHARYELLARMDDDDTSAPERFRLQTQLLQRHPHLAAVGGAWDVLEPSGQTRVTIRPPTDPSRLAWQLHLANCLAHGSVMLRRSVLLSVGGYDPRLDKAQDWELWLRLLRAGARIGAVPQTIYRHQLRTQAPFCTSQAQAAASSTIFLSAWNALPEGDSRLFWGVVNHVFQGNSQATTEIEHALDVAGPSRTGLALWLWNQWLQPLGERKAHEACRKARLREIVQELRVEGIDGVWLWGAGNHSRWVLEHARKAGLHVHGLVDDNLAGRDVLDHTVRAPDQLQPGDVALISTDRFEEQVWARSAPLRHRGVHVIRFYDSEPIAVVRR